IISIIYFDILINQLNNMKSRTLIMLLLVYIIVLHGNEDDNSYIENIDSDADADVDPMNMLTPSTLDETLDSFYVGDTYLCSTSPNILTNSIIRDNICEFQLNSEVTNYASGRLLIGELNEKRRIISVELIPYDINGNNVLDELNNPIRYISSAHNFGHLLDLMHPEYEFAYMKCYLTLLPNSNFVLKDLFFHFTSHPLMPSNEVSKGIITGESSFSIDSISQTYHVSVQCPLGYICNWLLDNQTMDEQPDTDFTFILHERHVGYRTLSYVAFCGSIRQTLASLDLIILPRNISSGETTLKSTLHISTYCNQLEFVKVNLE
ncbi:unnamed protein product, partial [Adineta ricciae]